MAVILNVPLVSQIASDECWYASACMVAYFRRPGPRLGLPNEWRTNKGIVPNNFPALAQSEGLLVYNIPVHVLSNVQLENALRHYGPLWSAGQWDGVGHVVVLTG